MPIDIFAPATLDIAVKQLPPAPSFLKDKFFKRVQLEPTIKILFDIYKGKRRVAPFVSPNNKAPVAEKIGYSTNEAVAPLVSVKDVTNIEDIMKRTAGETLINSGISPDERALTLLAQTMTDFDEMITRREEVMCAQALFEGKINVIGEDVNYTIDFGLTNKGTASVLWDAESSTADPIKDLKAWASQCAIKGYRTPDTCVMSRNAYNAFVDRCMALGYFDQKNFIDVSIKPERLEGGVTYVGRLLDPSMELYVYEEWYVDDWTNPDKPVEKPIIPKGHILLGSTSAKATFYYGCLTFTDPITKAFRTIMNRRGADSWVQKDPDARMFKICARPLPVPQEVDAWFAGKVAASK